LYVRNTKPTL